MWLVTLAVLAIFIIFAHPAISLLPAVHGNHFPILNLLFPAGTGLTLTNTVMIALGMIDPHESRIRARSDRLALICSRLC